MADSKITALTAVTEVTDSDLFPVVSDMTTTPVTRKITGTNLMSGWIKAPAWTYASASTFTISGDYTSVYKNGLRLRWTQTTVKYGVVVSSSYSAPNTTVTIAVNTDYTIANAAITARAYSYFENPIGWPVWFNWTPIVTPQTGAITSYTVNLAKYNATKAEIKYQIDITVTTNGTGAGYVLVTLPFSITSIHGYGREAAVTGNMLQAYIVSGTQLLIARYDGAYPAGNGYFLSMKILATW